jgi:hypothetical protein
MACAQAVPKDGVFLGVLVKHNEDGWCIHYYQASRLD